MSTTEQELLGLVAEVKRVETAWSNVSDKVRCGEFENEYIKLSERICATKPDTIKGVMLKMRALWNPMDRDHMPTTYFASAIADLERISGVSLDDDGPAAV